MVLIIRPVCASSSYSGGLPIIKQDSKKVLEALYIHDGELLTTEDVAKLTNFKKAQLMEFLLLPFSGKTLALAHLPKIKLNDGTYKAVKFLSLTPAGKRFAEEIL